MMTPTFKLRFVERQAPLHPMYKKVNERGELVNTTQTIKVLQQWWERSKTDVNGDIVGTIGEWRDVPTGEE